MLRALPLVSAARVGVLVGCGLAVLAAGACRQAVSDNRRPLAARLDPGPSGRSIVVPVDQPTVAAALAAAGPGDLVLLSAGVYREQVEIDVPRVVLRGVDRNGVVFDGGNELEEGIVLGADGVVVENLTVRRYRGDGIHIGDTAEADAAADAGAGAQLDGFRVSYVTAYGNGRSGVRARAARGGVIEAVHSSGHPEAGITVEACRPCNAVVRASVAEANAIGFHAVDATGDLFVVGSTWRSNRVGLVVRPDAETDTDTDDTDDAADADAGPGGAEEWPADRPAVVIAGNLVAGNANPEAPTTEAGPFGSGIVVSGPMAADVVRNRVSAHPGVGVAVTDADRRPPLGNVVRENVAEANGTDLAFYLVSVASDDTVDNCFAANGFTSSVPADVESVLPCGPRRRARAPARGMRFPAPWLPIVPAPTGTKPLVPPSSQAQLPVVTAPARPASGGPPTVDVETMVVPAPTS